MPNQRHNGNMERYITVVDHQKMKRDVCMYDIDMYNSIQYCKIYIMILL